MKKVIAFTGLLSIVLLYISTVSADSLEIKSRKTLDALGQSIRAYGYVCPRAAIAYNRGYVHEGVEIKIFCGPKTGGCNINLVYRLILDANTGKAVSLTPWK